LTPQPSDDGCAPRRRRDSFAKRTGQSRHAAVGATAGLLGAALALVDGLSRSAYGSRLMLPSWEPAAFACGLVGPALLLIGMMWPWWTIRCPRCGIRVHWWHVSRQPIFRKDTSNPDLFGCRNCGFRPE
jgi:hypothetical protein